MLLFRGNVSQIRGGSLGAVVLLHQVLQKTVPGPYGKWLEGFSSPLDTQQSADTMSAEGVI